MIKKLLCLSIVSLFLMLSAGCDSESESDEAQLVSSDLDSLFPESDIRGWELDETNTGLKNDYSRLTYFDVKSADSDKGFIDSYNFLHINANQTITNKRIAATLYLDLSAGGITLQNCLIQPTTSLAQGMPLVNAGNTVIMDSEIDGSQLPSSVYANGGIGFSGSGKILRCNVHHCATGIVIYNAPGQSVSVAENNYVHDLIYVEPAHMDGITMRASEGAGVIIRNNRAVVDSAICTGALFIQTSARPIDRLLIKGNLLEGYGYNFSMGISIFRYGKNIFVIDNRFNLYEGPTGYGAVAIDPGIYIAEFSENYLDDPLAADHKGAPLLYP